MKYNKIKMMFTVGALSASMALGGLSSVTALAASTQASEAVESVGKESELGKSVEEVKKEAEEKSDDKSIEELTKDTDDKTVKEVELEDSSVKYKLPNAYRQGYKFKGWKSGNETYEGGSEIKITGDMDFKAIWESYKLTLNGQGANVKGDEEVLEIENDSSKDYIYSVRLPRLAKDGYKFKEWNTERDGSGTSYSVGDHVKITEDITLYAIFDKNEVKLDFNGGSDDENKTTEEKEYVIEDHKENTENEEDNSKEKVTEEDSTESTEQKTEEASTESSTEASTESSTETSTESTEQKTEETSTESSEAESTESSNDEASTEQSIEESTEVGE